ncbi:MAG: lipopolysaccharide kinase InaA family protein [Thermodesulfobacteriota bacterium]|nr:lipopolysaccharide kinase InaA family protein [Thermodesulfobacteriota bacterium]
MIKFINKSSEINGNTIDECLKIHHSIKIKGGENLFKNRRRTTVTCVKTQFNGNSFELCIKEVRNPGIFIKFKELFRKSRGRKAWEAAKFLEGKKIPIPSKIALLEEKDFIFPKRSFFITEFIPDSTSLFQYIEDHLKKNLKRKRDLINALAKFITDLHRKDICHYDLQTRNILVKENNDKWEFFLLDLESIKLNKMINRKIILKNLVELNDLPLGISRRDRIYFLKKYQEISGISLKKKDIEEVQRISKKRQEKS